MTEVLHLPVHPVPPDALDRARGFLRRVQLDDNLFTDHLGRITTALLRPGHHSERAGGLANISRQFTQGSMYAGVSRLSLSMNLTHKSLYLCDIRLFTGIDELGIAVFMIDARPGSLTLDTTALALVPLYALARCIEHSRDVHADLLALARSSPINNNKVAAVSGCWIGAHA
jgi:hypothetical protein